MTLYFKKQNKILVTRGEFLATSSLSRGSRKGFEQRPLLFHANYQRWRGTGGSTPCTLHVWVSKAAPCPPPKHSSPEQHNHLMPQGCSRSDLLKVKQAETEPWSPLFFQDSAFELELNHAKVNGGYLFLIVIFRGSPQTSEPPDRKMWTPCSVKSWAACQERDLPEQEEIALPFLIL